MQVHCVRHTDIKAYGYLLGTFPHLIADSPRRDVRPFLEFLNSPYVGLVFVAGGAGIRNPGLFSLDRRDKAKGVSSHEIVLDRLLNRGHVASHTITTGTGRRVMCVILDRPFQSGRIVPVVASETECIPFLNEIRFVLIAVHLMTVEAAHLAVIHGALHKIVALHPVFVRSQIGELIEVRNAGLQFFKLPEAGEAHAGEKTDGPVVVLAFDGVLQGFSLTVALDADVVAADEIKRLRIDDVRAGWMGDMFRSGSMALFAPHVPLGHLLCQHVVVDRVAAVAGGARWPLHVGWAVVRNPPVCSGFNVIREPAFLRDVPLRGKGVVIVTPPGEISLLVPASIDEGDIVESKGAERVRLSEVTEHRVRMEPRIANDIRHPCPLPSVELFLVAPFAVFRANKVSES